TAMRGDLSTNVLLGQTFDGERAWCGLPVCPRCAGARICGGPPRGGRPGPTAPLPPPAGGRGTGDRAQSPLPSRTIDAAPRGVPPRRPWLLASGSVFAAAEPAEPLTIAPAWPIVLPGGAVTPAM